MTPPLLRLGFRGMTVLAMIASNEIKSHAMVVKATYFV